MAIGGVSDYKEISPILAVEWGPWRSDTMALQRGGWQVVMDQSYDHRSYDNTVRVMIRDPRSGMIGYCQFRNDPHMGSYGYRGLLLKFDLISEEMRIPFSPMYNPRRMFDEPGQYAAVDCTPQMVHIGELVHQHQIFKNAPVYEKHEGSEIIVKEESVIELLGRIKEMQQPEQDRIRKENKGSVIQTKVHAQIITLDSRR